MRRLPLFLVLALTAAIGRGAEVTHLAAIQNIKRLPDQNGARVLEVTYVRHCQDQLLGAFSTPLPTRMPTLHGRTVIGVMVHDTGIDCAAADAIERTQVHFHALSPEDYSSDPILLQPREG